MNPLYPEKANWRLRIKQADSDICDIKQTEVLRLFDSQRFAEQIIPLAFSKKVSTITLRLDEYDYD